MESTFIYIKNMVCDRCIMAVRSLLQEMGLEPLSVRLGEAELSRPLSAAGRASLDAALRRLGFELIDGRRERLAEQVKTLVIELVHRENGCLRVNLLRCGGNDGGEVLHRTEDRAGKGAARL